MQTLANKAIVFITLAATFSLFSASVAWAHCDSMDGPVVIDAKLALESGNPAPVLKWVSEDNEAEIRRAFEQTLDVRKAGGTAQELADRYFFETLVRIHRAGEGAPYTGLKEAESVDDGIMAADRALEMNDASALAADISTKIAKEIKARHKQAVTALQHAEHSAQAGRDYVEAYVQYVHYVEAVNALAQGHMAHGEHKPADENHSAH